MATNKLMGTDIDRFNKVHTWFKPGDYISCIGYASRTKTGELTLKANSPIELLTPCLLKMPNKLTDKGIINNNRVLNYLVNPDSKQPIIIKSRIIQCIRQFLLQRDFLEVQTPILSNEGTGANANPFKTKFKDTEVQLRVAPELWLKKLVIGGFDKVFEIGNNFRNEGIDQTHNPEFTSCEFYQAYTSLEELMQMTEELLTEIFKTFNMTSILEKAKFPRYEFLPTLEQVTGVPLNDLSFDGLLQYYKRLDLQVPPNPNPTSLLNNLSEVYLESLSVSKHPNTPVFIYNQPELLSPLAKSSLVNGTTRVSSRFELFINGKEFINAYEEENDPYQQFAKFKQQQESKREFNDDEMLIPDWQYVQTMKLGLPPTGGWGIGIDRLAMFISGVERIDNVLPFGNLRDVLKQ
ncbi:MSK1 [Candida margitis]|uniref:MSK1 n=1 Tax=Candida margitis TaxID=1775924 RepID=UPI002226E88A|nr:MSK1 [Candida margitis]KAI5970718.1 MSK1 [Candida margitis]